MVEKLQKGISGGKGMTQDTQDIEIILSQPQTAVLASRKAVILDMAGQGSGKSQNIGYSSGMFITDFPEVIGFIGANTHMQLSQSTLARVFETWKRVYDFTQYDAKGNRGGSYVVDKKPPPHFTRFHEFKDYSGTISFYNGAMVFTGSLENYMAHDGKQFGWAHLDETKDTKEEALKSVIIGRLRQYGLWYERDSGDVYYNPFINGEKAEEMNLVAWNPLYIHTSPALSGVKWLNEMFSLSKFEKEIKNEVMKGAGGFFHKVFDNKEVVIYPVHHNAPNLPPNYIENQIKNLVDDDKIMKLVFGYPFSQTGGAWFSRFRRDKHVREVRRIVGEPSHISLDFNVVPYMTCLCANVTYVTKYIDRAGIKHLNPVIDSKAIQVMIIRIYREYCLKDPQNTTEGIADAFKSEHDISNTELFYYGDANGLTRIEGLGSLTNFKILEDNLYDYLHNNSKCVRFPNIRVFTRRDLVNKILAGLFPDVELEIDEGCTELIDDMEHTKLGPKGKIKKLVKDPVTEQEYQEHGHTGDALEYLVCELCKHLILN